jgi:hypothetical protein
MGRLTDDTARLRGEIDTLRVARGALMRQLARGAGDLAQAVSAMTAGLAAARADMAKKTRGERGSFLSGLVDDVHSLLEVFSGARSDMARSGRNDREASLSGMRNQVASLRRETADDLAGARLALRGHGPAMKRKGAAPMGERSARHDGIKAKRGRK